MTESDPLGAIAASEQHDPTKGVRVRQNGKKPGPPPTPKPGPTGSVAPDGGDDTSAIPDGVPTPPAEPADDAFAAAIEAATEKTQAAATAAIATGHAEIPITGVAVDQNGTPLGGQIAIGSIQISVDELDGEMVRAVIERAIGPLPAVEVNYEAEKAYVPMSTGVPMTMVQGANIDVVREFTQAALALYFHLLELQPGDV